MCRCLTSNFEPPYLARIIKSNTFDKIEKFMTEMMALNIIGQKACTYQPREVRVTD